MQDPRRCKAVEVRGLPHPCDPGSKTGALRDKCLIPFLNGDRIARFAFTHAGSHMVDYGWSMKQMPPGSTRAVSSSEVPTVPGHRHQDHVLSISIHRTTLCA
jgi:hypothetical protein